MSKYIIVVYSLLAILTSSAFLFLYSQEGDDCGNTDKRLKSTFNESVLYGEQGATSQLERDSNFEKYKPSNAFDNDLSTSWVEGKPGDGSGEKLAFYYPSQIKKIGILPGYGTAKHFPLNNRVKSASLSVYEIAGRDATQCLGILFTRGRLLRVEKLVFQDFMTLQYFNIPDVPESETGYMYIVEITSVYKGSRYNDTCIAEVTYE